MAEYRGQDGSLSYAGTVIAELTNFEVSGISKAMIETTRLGDSHKTFRGGSVDSGTVTATTAYDPDDTEHQAWRDSVINGTDASVAFVALTTTGESLDFNAIPDSASFSWSDNDAENTVTFTAKITGQITVTTTP